MTSTTMQPFSVWINPEVLEKFNMYAAEALTQHNSEIGGFIKIEEEGDNVFVTDLFIPKQSASAGSFEISADMDTEFMRAMMKAGKVNEIPLWKGLVHSHPEGMGPSMSGVDVTAIQRRAEDSECFSLILSAKRSADSTRMAMHYCMKFRGKTLMFPDLKVQVGWDGERLAYANEIAEQIAKKLGASSKSGIATITDAIQNAVCGLPPTFEEERKELRAQIAAEVKEKIANRYPARTRSSGSNYTPWMPMANKHLGEPQERSEGQQRLWTKRDSSGIPYSEQADMEKAWKNAQRLYAIGYDKIDPANPNPNSIVTKQEAKKARKLHRNVITELNKQLRALGGPGIGDLVLVTQEAIVNNPHAVDMIAEPNEVEDFSIEHGLVSYEVGGEIFWANELDTVSLYEDIMNWNEKATA